MVPDGVHEVMELEDDTATEELLTLLEDDSTAEELPPLLEEELLILLEDDTTEGLLISLELLTTESLLTTSSSLSFLFELQLTASNAVAKNHAPIFDAVFMENLQSFKHY